MEENEDDVYMVTIHDRYAAWPSSLVKMCLAKFAISYEPVYKGTQSHDRDVVVVDDDDVDANEGEVADMSDIQQNVITLCDDLGCMRKHKFESILHMTSFKQHAEPERYYRSHLLLYLPWNNEGDLIVGYASYNEHYTHVCDVVENNAEAFHLHNDILDAAIEHVADNGPPEIVWYSIAPTFEENNVHDGDDGVLVI